MALSDYSYILGIYKASHIYQLHIYQCKLPCSSVVLLKHILLYQWTTWSVPDRSMVVTRHMSVEPSGRPRQKGRWRYLANYFRTAGRLRKIYGIVFVLFVKLWLQSKTAKRWDLKCRANHHSFQMQLAPKGKYQFQLQFNFSGIHKWMTPLAFIQRHWCFNWNISFNGN